jgi:uncharacterized FAD-dependent dehydrogenase
MAKRRVAIIGSGPAGLFAALELAKNQDLEIMVLEKQAVSSGGMRNDCKLNLSPRIGMELKDLQLDETNAYGLIDHIDNKFLEHGAPSDTFGEDIEHISRLVAKAKRCGLDLIPARQRHVGTDQSNELINSFKRELGSLGIIFRNHTEVISIVPNKSGGFNLILENQGNSKNLESDFLVVAPGRSGSDWFRHQADDLGIKYVWGPIDVGIRLELPFEYYRDLTDMIYDPKIIMDLQDKEPTRTFCTNPGGRIRIEPHNGNTYRLINGDANKRTKTRNTNLAILTRLYLTDPLVDTRKEGIDMAKKTNEYGGGKPLIQKLGKFFDNKRSKESDFRDYSDESDHYVRPTLPIGQVAPGDINLAYNYKIVNKLKIFLERLDRLAPGVMNPGNNLYAPEIKFYETTYLTTKSLETNIQNIFVAGDGVGKSRGIVGAALTGILAARGILEKN